MSLHTLFAPKSIAACSISAAAEIYSAAAEMEQAAIAFELAKQMVERDEKLLSMSQIFKRTITVEKTASFYRVLSADAKSKHGFNAHGVIFDELHAQPNRELWDVLTTSTGARRQPLIVAITTAGFDRNSICWEIHQYANQVLRGIIDDPAFLPIIFAAEEKDDWQSPEVWKKANPGLGISIKYDYLEAECKKAIDVPAYENTFRRLHLNQWTRQDVRWIPMHAWDGCKISPEYSGACFTGLDLSRTTDLAAMAHVFPKDDRYHLLMRFWLPKDGIESREKRDRVPYREWEKMGLITLTPGPVINYDYIFNQIDEDAQQFDIQEVVFDRWGASEVTRKISDAGLIVTPFGQGFSSMSSPSKEFLKLILENRIAHGANPILRWNADNVVVEQDAAGNIKPSKKKSEQKIDGIVAAIMGLDRALRHRENKSVYLQRGLITL
jgi:phage terminase large subunit-like protein